MKKFFLTKEYDKSLINKMEKLCKEPNSEVQKDDIVFDDEVKFSDGLRMLIQVCASGNPKKECCWTQGVLLDEDGYERGCTDVGESFQGEYVVEYREVEYTVCIIPKR